MNFKMVLTTAALFALLIPALASAEGLVDGTADAGQTKSAICAACHGSDGNSVNPVWPSIAGQHPTYIAKQLHAFKDGGRSNPLMSAQAMMLSDQDINDLAVYFSGKQLTAKTVADAATVDSGRAIYQAGNAKKGVPACMACHGPAGSGNLAAAYPALSGQHSDYVAAQLRAYAKGERTSDAPTKMMRDIAALLSEEEILAVASYVQGLH